VGDKPIELGEQGFDLGFSFHGIQFLEVGS
jgi:hypothetical protein